MADALNAYWLVIVYVSLGLLPGAVASRYWRLPPCFWVPAALAGGCVWAYALFWLYFFWPGPARIVAEAAPFCSALGFAVLLHRSERVRAHLTHRDCWLPFSLMITLMFGYLAFLAWPGVTSTVRFTVPLPPEDNLVPRYLADRLYFGYDLGPPVPPITSFLFETRSSDRPPLQAALLLAVRALSLDGARGAIDHWTYQVVTTFFQLGWVPALYALCRTLNLSGRQFTFVMVGTAASGFFLVHSLYTWPKLLAAWLFLTALALVLHDVNGQAERPARLGVAVGGLLALALLAHGGPFFSIVALPFLFVQRGAWRVVSARQLVGASLTGALLLVPWLAYQRFYDPPGNRLIKLHLAGVWDADARGSLEAIADAYGSLKLPEWMAGRWANLKEQWLVFGKSQRTHPVDWVQWQQFFHHLPAIDFLCFGVLALLARRRPRLGPALRLGLPQLAIYMIASLVLWIVMMMPPGYAMIHHSSFAATALLFVCAAAYAALLPRRWGTVVLGLHVATFMAFWLPMRTLQHAPAPARWDASAAILMAAGLIAFAALLAAWRSAEESGLAASEPRAYPLGSNP